MSKNFHEVINAKTINDGKASHDENGKYRLRNAARMVLSRGWLVGA